MAASFKPGSSPIKITSTSGPRFFHDNIAFRWITLMCGFMNGFGAEKIVKKLIVEITLTPKFLTDPLSLWIILLITTDNPDFYGDKLWIITVIHIYP
jgi:hypothetical protein